MFSIMPRSLFSKLSIACTCGGDFREENPNVSLRLPSALGLRKKNAFHLMRLQRCSVFSISLRLYSGSDGNGISLVELSILVDSITVGA